MDKSFTGKVVHSEGNLLTVAQEDMWSFIRQFASGNYKSVTTTITVALVTQSLTAGGLGVTATHISTVTLLSFRMNWFSSNVSTPTGYQMTRNKPNLTLL